MDGPLVLIQRDLVEELRLDGMCRFVGRASHGTLCTTQEAVVEKRLGDQWKRQGSPSCTANERIKQHMEMH